MENNYKIGCPKCGSTEITANKKGYQVGKAVGGAILTGGVGLLAGFHGSNKILVTCLACSKRFKAGEGKRIWPEKEPIQNQENILKKISENDPNELNRIVCTSCKSENLTNHTFCRNCGKQLADADERIHSDEVLKLFACPSCKELTPSDAKNCARCGTTIPSSTKSNSGCMVIFLIGIVISGFTAFLIL